ncbi:hypothetical protein PT285_02355 [Lactobacillus sp. ESL0791]|uniref:hypothetical protein n=1 Tax=Lactobacillus sp. ESL0791 TaxID=2983234 RepID=UPI0023F8E54B|nr:hypothetical protein [Lactobacillus sp. ESL0791]MDF7638276.1 hypothetical protein [Lactobacillus sp. ESL0791]
MNKKRILTLTAALALAGSTLVSSSVLAADNTSTAEKASTAKKMPTEKYLAAFPQTIRGTWYNYVGNKLCKTVIGKKEMTIYINGKKDQYFTLHAYVNHNAVTTNKATLAKTKHWVWAEKTTDHKLDWLRIHGWSDAAGAGMFVNLSKINSHKVLTTASGAGVWVEGHAYQTPKLAKKLQKKRYSQFAYQE